jgi:hypothetical protein
MPKSRKGPVQDPELYEKLRDEGNSKQKAARVKGELVKALRNS